MKCPQNLLSAIVSISSVVFSVSMTTIAMATIFMRDSSAVVDKIDVTEVSHGSSIGCHGESGHRQSCDPGEHGCSMCS